MLRGARCLGDRQIAITGIVKDGIIALISKSLACKQRLQTLRQYALFDVVQMVDLFQNVVHTASDLKILVLEDVDRNLYIPKVLKELDTVRVDELISLVELLVV